MKVWMAPNLVRGDDDAMLENKIVRFFSFFLFSHQLIPTSLHFAFGSSVP
jgi:hypothetical protein